MDQPPTSLKTDLSHAGRGMLMGGFDVIPGVSGGTVALVLGIYERLVSAISHVDLTLLNLLFSRRWKDAAERIDLRFLLPLGTGIATGVIGLASTMAWLLEHRPQLTSAAFFGLIIGSAWLVARSLEGWTWPHAGLAALGTVLAYWLVGQPALAHPPRENWYLFLCGSIGICAMILPGVSGAFLLVVLGRYRDVVGLIPKLLRGEEFGQTLTAMAIFLAGCLAGLIGFSKLLKVLLRNWPRATLAILCGVMAGSLRKLWPFKKDLTPDEVDRVLKRLANTWPDQWDARAWLTVAVAAGGVLLVLGLGAIGNRTSDG